MEYPVASGHEWIGTCAYNDYSQSGEDGVLEAIFLGIGAANKWCCECGASDGLFFSNTRNLIEKGWQGVLIESDADAFSRLTENNKAFGSRVRLEHATINRETRIESVLQKYGAPNDIDLMVIDVDGQDFYVWNSMLVYRPRVVVIEFDPSGSVEFCPSICGQGQAGPQSIINLARGKLYDCVWASRFNMIFVVRPLGRVLLDLVKKEEIQNE